MISVKNSKRTPPFQGHSISDRDAKKLEDINKKVERAQLISELAEIKRLIPVYEARRRIVRDIPKFWPIAFWNHPVLAEELKSKEDMEVLEYLTDVWIERNPVEPRVYTIQCTFTENPYFDDRILSKVFEFKESPIRKKEVADSDGFKLSMLDFDWYDDAKGLAQKICWKQGRNLCKKYPPRYDDGELIDLGSFFNWFECEGDPFDIGVVIAEELFEDAVDHFTGKVNEDSDEEGDDDK